MQADSIYKSDYHLYKVQIKVPYLKKEKKVHVTNNESGTSILILKFNVQVIIIMLVLNASRVFFL